jgi:hypothetical protein
VGGPGLADAGGMQSTTSVISLELSLDGDSLSGLASDGKGGRREFSGWLGLVSAIEALIDIDPQGGDE